MPQSEEWRASKSQRALEVPKKMKTKGRPRTHRKDTNEPAIFQVLRRECPHNSPSMVQESTNEAAGLISKGEL